jgi:hypothetical protein
MTDEQEKLNRHDPPLPVIRNASHLTAQSRRSLHRKTPSLSSYPATPITKHYELNAQILSAFESHYSRKVYQIAYAIGIQFVETALLEIPKHGYYYSPRHERERMQSSLDSVRVTQLLKQMQEKDGLVFSEQDQIHVDKLAELALIQVQEASEDQFESQRAVAEQMLRGSGTDDGRSKLYASDSWAMCDVIATAYSSFTKSICPNAVDSIRQDETKGESFETAAKLPNSVGESGGGAPNASCEIDHGTSYTSSVGFHEIGEKSSTPSSVAESLLLEKALYLSGLEVSSEESSSVAESNYEQNTVADEEVDSRKRQPNQFRLQWSTVSRFYHEDFDHLRKSGRIRVSFANTYQGRLPESTNGCTVIAPLLCIHHLLNDEFPDPGLTDAVIVEVIDAETPSILLELRRKLRLSAQAFLIPSDAHDYLIENGQLSQDHFVTVTGGNILDELHLKEFVEALDRADRRKVASCFFFHEHVVAILKVRRDEQTSWYDLIDGLPLRETYSWMSLSNRNPSVEASVFASHEESDNAILPQTARVRCLNLEALTVCLRWYACSKFSVDNVAYIDHYEWDDESFAFDPRVFQGFVWGSCD